MDDKRFRFDLVVALSEGEHTMSRGRLAGKLFTVAAMVLFVAGCKGSSGFGSSPTLPLAGAQTDQGTLQQFAKKNKIQHVVIIIQENRSFNNLFYGYPGAKTAT
jgi:phospholipase C